MNSKFEEACREHDLQTILQIGRTDSREAFAYTFIKGFNPEISRTVLRMGNFDLELAYFYLCGLDGENITDLDSEYMLIGCEWLYAMGIRDYNILRGLCEAGNILMVKWALSKPDLRRNLQKCKKIAKEHGHRVIYDLLC